MVATPGVDLRSVRALFAPLLAVAFFVLPTAGCGPDSANATIERERFIQTYVDLRVAALETDSQRIAEGARGEVLARNGVTEQDLVHFAEVHAAELEFMRDVWNEVELRMDALSPDSAGR